MVQAHKPNEALESLLHAAEVQDAADPVAAFVNSIFTMKTGTYDFLLWHYTNVMLLMQEKKDPRGKTMATLLMEHPKFKADIENPERKGHPWNLVLWNVARYARSAKDTIQYERLYQQAINVTCESKANVTMMTFAISMSAERLLWCRESKIKELAQARIAFENVCRDVAHAGMTDEMKKTFRIDQVGDAMGVGNKTLKKISQAYLK